MIPTSWGFSGRNMFFTLFDQTQRLQLILQYETTKLLLQLFCKQQVVSSAEFWNIYHESSLIKCYPPSQSNYCLKLTNPRCEQGCHNGFDSFFMHDGLIQFSLYFPSVYYRSTIASPSKFLTPLHSWCSSILEWQQPYVHEAGVQIFWSGNKCPRIAAGRHELQFCSFVCTYYRVGQRHGTVECHFCAQVLIY